MLQLYVILVRKPPVRGGIYAKFLIKGKTSNISRNNKKRITRFQNKKYNNMVDTQKYNLYVGINSNVGDNIESIMLCTERPRRYHALVRNNSRAGLWDGQLDQYIHNEQAMRELNLQVYTTTT